MEPVEKEFGNRLKVLMDALNMKPAQFASSLGMRPQTLSSFTGARGNAPSYETLKKILFSIPRVDPEWLLTGRGEPLRATVHQSGNTGQTIGQVTGGTVNYSVEDCREQLQLCREAEAKANRELAIARGRIIELMDKHQG